MAEYTSSCVVCNVFFTADKRVGKRQKTCGRPSCKLEYKRRCQKDWLRRNPGYFKGRYENTKEWLREHPGYLKDYRKRCKSREKSDIQEQLTLLKSTPLSTLRDIQEQLTACFIKHLAHNNNSRCLDIQVKSSALITAFYLVMIYKNLLKV